QYSIRGCERSHRRARPKPEQVPNRYRQVALWIELTLADGRHEPQDVSYLMRNHSFEIVFAGIDTVAWIEVKTDVRVEADCRRRTEGLRVIVRIQIDHPECAINRRRRKHVHCLSQVRGHGRLRQAPVKRRLMRIGRRAYQLRQHIKVLFESDEHLRVGDTNDTVWKCFAEPGRSEIDVDVYHRRRLNS